MKLFFLSILFFFLYINISFAKSDPKSLDDQELCDVATYSGFNANKLWKIGSYKKYVDEAKKRGIDCGVKSLIKGEVINIPISEVKLMLNQFNLYDGVFTNEIDEALIKAIAQLMAKKGFSYEDPNSSKAFTLFMNLMKMLLIGLKFVNIDACRLKKTYLKYLIRGVQYIFVGCQKQRVKSRQNMMMTYVGLQRIYQIID